jgi:hypothetical protein
MKLISLGLINFRRPERLIKIISTRYFLVIKEINKYLVDMILINSFRSGPGGRENFCSFEFSVHVTQTLKLSLTYLATIDVFDSCLSEEKIDIILILSRTHKFGC